MSQHQSNFLKTNKWRRLPFIGLKWWSYLTTAVAIIVLSYIVYFIFAIGSEFINWHFLFGEYIDEKNVSILPAFIGTLYLIGIALVIAVPIGIFTAIFLTEYKLNQRFLRWLRVAIETLAGIPSIVYGMFGFLVFVLALGWGFSMLAGGVTLSIMILPIIIRTTEESLLAVPMTYREASYSFGATRVRTIFKIVLPSAKGGVVSGIILAIGRVVSESAVLILTIGGFAEIMPSLTGPGISLAVAVYYFWQIRMFEAAAATAVVLIVLVIVINILATVAGKLLTRGNMAVNE